MPPALRKSGSPQLVEMPAPTRTTTFRASDSILTQSSISEQVCRQLLGEVDSSILGADFDLTFCFFETCPTLFISDTGRPGFDFRSKSFTEAIENPLRSVVFYSLPFD
jgi:hypothetical protein